MSNKKHGVGDIGRERYHGHLIKYKFGTDTILVSIYPKTHKYRQFGLAGIAFDDEMLANPAETFLHSSTNLASAQTRAHRIISLEYKKLKVQKMRVSKFLK